jgi:hypothetical protein
VDELEAGLLAASPRLAAEPDRDDHAIAGIDELVRLHGEVIELALEHREHLANTVVPLIDAGLPRANCSHILHSTPGSRKSRIASTPPAL